MTRVGAAGERVAGAGRGAAAPAPVAPQAAGPEPLAPLPPADVGGWLRHFFAGHEADAYRITDLEAARAAVGPATWATFTAPFAAAQARHGAAARPVRLRRLCFRRGGGAGGGVLLSPTVFTGAHAKVALLLNDYDATFRAAKFLRVRELGGQSRPDDRTRVSWGSDVFHELHLLCGLDSPLRPFGLASLPEQGKVALMTSLLDASLSACVVRAGGPEPDLARQVARAGLATLQTLQARGFAHLDVKPANFLIRADGAVALADLGAARRIDAATGRVVGAGTYDYMPAEALREEAGVAEPLHAWSLGVCFVEAACHVSLFAAATTGPVVEADGEGGTRVRPPTEPEWRARALAATEAYGRWHAARIAPATHRGQLTAGDDPFDHLLVDRLGDGPWADGSWSAGDADLLWWALRHLLHPDPAARVRLAVAAAHLAALPDAAASRARAAVRAAALSASPALEALKAVMLAQQAAMGRAAA